MSYTNQPQYSRRGFLERAARGIVGTGTILATGGLSPALAQETKSKTKELTELLESNPDVFPRNFAGGLTEYIDRDRSLPKLPKGQQYGTRLPLSIRFDLPNSKRAVLAYRPKDSDEPVGVYDQDARFGRDTGIKVRINNPTASLELDVYEKDSTTIGGNQIPINVTTVFHNNDLDDVPNGYNRRYYFMRINPLTKREEVTYIPESGLQFDQATANTKYNEMIELILQEARKMVQSSGRK